MKKFLGIIVLGLFFFNPIFAAERSKAEIKNGIFIEDIEEFGTFNRINTAPIGMFETKHRQFIQKSKYSQEKIGLIFVTQKALLDKYPERLMMGMGYFEFFYMQQLKDNKKEIATFIKKQPNIDTNTRKVIKKIYGLNKARKSMRNTLGFTLEDDVQDVLKNYYVLSQLFSLGEKITIKLNFKEKKMSKRHSKISKYIGTIKNLVKDKNEKRVDDKKFNKEYSKKIKKINSEIKKLNKYYNYNKLGEFLNLIQEVEIKKTSTLLSAYNIIEFLLNEIKDKEVKKKFKIDLTNADFSNFTQKELMLLGEVSKTTKIFKVKKSNKIQLDILNLENNNIPINKFIDEFRGNALEFTSINFQIQSADKMKRWVQKDWANAWKTPIPEKINDTSKGIMIDLSGEEVKSIKAQLSIEYYKDLLNLDTTEEINKSLEDILSSIDASSFNFSYELNDYAKFLGDVMNLDIKNYVDLTALANAIYSADWSAEEYASTYQYNVEAINTLASGSSSFDTGQVAQSIGAALQDAADTILAASAAGLSVDLESAAAGFGYDSFASAVEAYNAANGTSYTTAEAAEALGQ